MSFTLTVEQIKSRQKCVTRRLGWRSLKAGDLVRAVVKGMGLRKGESPEPLAILCVVNVRRERLGAIQGRDVEREGFPAMTHLEFVSMFCEHMGCKNSDEVTRIEFRYVPGGRLC